MKSDRRQVLAGTAATALLPLLGGPAAAQTRWDLADEYDKEGLTGQACQQFQQMLNERVGDSLNITYHGGGALGYDSADHFDAVQSGAVQSAITLVTQLGGIDPVFNLSSLPFIAQTPREAYLLWQAARPVYERIFQENGMVLLWALPNPPSGIHGPQPITSVEALDGLRIRTYDVNGTKTLRNAGATPLQIAWSDLIPQLSTGGIDGVLTSADGGVQLSLWDYVSDFTELNYAMGLFMMHVNQADFDALPEETRTALRDIVPKIEEYNWRIVRESIEQSYEIMRENGMTVTTADQVPQEVFDFLREAGRPITDAWLEATGERGAAIMDRYEELRAAE